MRDLGDAMEALSDFESLVRNGLHPGKSLRKVTYRDRWDSLKFAYLQFRIGQLTVEANAHSSYRSGHLAVWVWDFNKPASDVCRFDMGADADHVARVVVDYLNEYEATA